MSVITLLPSVSTTDQDLFRVQQRFEGPVSALITTPWGNGILVTGLVLTSQTGNQTIFVRHGLGRSSTGAVIWNCDVPVYGPWGMLCNDPNNSTFTINLPAGIPVGARGALDLWVG